MKKYLMLILLALLASCTSKEQRIREAEVKYEREAKARALAELEEWREIKSLALKATGVTSSVKGERKLAYVKLSLKFPNSERWDDILRSIEVGEMYPKHEDFIWEIKKSKGWEEIE